MSEKRPTPKKTRAMEKLEEEWSRLADDLIERIRQGDLSWKREWANLDSARNPVTGAYYQGSNVALLYRAMVERRTLDPRFCGFEQAKSQGWKVKKGARSVTIGRFSTILVDEEGKRVKGQGAMTPQERQAYIEAHEGARAIGITKPLHVFSLADMEGPPPYRRDERLPADMPVVDRLIERSVCPVDERPSDRACYIPALDKIVMPHRRQFPDVEGLANTLLHEQVHATGHPTRLNREIDNRFATPKYAREELVAELGSALAYSRLGIEYTELADAASMAARDNHAAYLKSWIGDLKDPAEAIRAVVGDASRAASLIAERHERAWAHGAERPARPVGKGGEAVEPEGPVEEFCGLEALTAAATAASLHAPQGGPENPAGPER